MKTATKRNISVILDREQQVTAFEFSFQFLRTRLELLRLPSHILSSLSAETFYPPNSQTLHFFSFLRKWEVHCLVETFIHSIRHVFIDDTGWSYSFNSRVFKAWVNNWKNESFFIHEVHIQEAIAVGMFLNSIQMLHISFNLILLLHSVTYTIPYFMFRGRLMKYCEHLFYFDCRKKE